MDGPILMTVLVSSGLTHVLIFVTFQVQMCVHAKTSFSRYRPVGRLFLKRFFFSFFFYRILAEEHVCAAVSMFLLQMLPSSLSGTFDSRKETTPSREHHNHLLQNNSGPNSRTSALLSRLTGWTAGPSVQTSKGG